MEQQPIRDYNGQRYTKEEGAAIIKELNDRTKYADAELNSMQLQGEAIKALQSGIYVEKFGAKADGVQLMDFSVTGNNLHSPSATFTPNDVGKIVSVAYAGEDDEHLVTTISAFVDVNNVTLSTAATNNVVGQMGSYGTDNLKPLQDAWRYGLENQLPIFASEGVYLVGDVNIDTGWFEVRLGHVDFTRKGMNFSFIGKGSDKTIFREIDGKTQRNGLYTRMFFFQFNSIDDLGDINIKRFSLDKNARSFTKQPVNEYAYEQSHCMHFASSEGDSFIDKVILDDVKLIDKTGGGITWSSSNIKIGSFYLTEISQKTSSFRLAKKTDASIIGSWNAATNTPDIFDEESVYENGDRYIVKTAGTHLSVSYSVDDQLYFYNGSWLKTSEGRFTTVNGILIGERGCIEASPFCTDIAMQRVNVIYSQIEPIESKSSDYENQRVCKVSSSNFDKLEYTEGKNKDPFYSSLEIVNTTVFRDFVVRSIRFKAINSTLKIKNTTHSIKGSFLNCDILVDYDPFTNALLPIQINPLTIVNGYKSNVVFDRCGFFIDSPDLEIAPDGYAIRSGNVSGGAFNNNISIINCNFDERLKSNVDAYAGGNWHLEGCVYSGDYRVLKVGGYSTYDSIVTLKNNDYSKIAPSTDVIHINNNTTNWILRVVERVPYLQWKVLTTGSTSDYLSTYEAHPTLVVSNISSATRRHFVGDKIEIINPAQGSYSNYICTVNGTPGTLKGVGFIDDSNVQNDTSTSFTPVLNSKTVTLNNAAAVAFNIPTNASVAFPISKELQVFNKGAGNATLTPAGGVTVTGKTVLATGEGVIIKKIATNEWISY